MERSDQELIDAVLAGDPESFEPLLQRHQARVFGTVRRYARREEEIQDIAQEIWLKVYSKLHTFRGDAPFEHWLMRLAVRTCYDFLRAHQRNREDRLTDITEEEVSWLERFRQDPDSAPEDEDAARMLVGRLLEMLGPKARLVLTLLEIEEKSVREISELTGWSVSLVKVNAFRARAEMRKCLARVAQDKYL